MARFAGDRPETGGALWDGTRKAWPLLFSASSHPLGVQSEYGAGRHTGPEGALSGSEAPKLMWHGMLVTVTYALYFSGRTMSKLLTMDEASVYLGISKLTLYGWVSARKLGFVKVGRLVKFKQEHLDRWIDQHTVKARSAAQVRVENCSEHG